MFDHLRLFGDYASVVGELICAKHNVYYVASHMPTPSPLSPIPFPLAFSLLAPQGVLRCQIGLSAAQELRLYGVFTNIDLDLQKCACCKETKFGGSVCSRYILESSTDSQPSFAFDWKLNKPFGTGSGQANRELKAMRREVRRGHNCLPGSLKNMR